MIPGDGQEVLNSLQEEKERRSNVDSIESQHCGGSYNLPSLPHFLGLPLDPRDIGKGMMTSECVCSHLY